MFYFYMDQLNTNVFIKTKLILFKIVEHFKYIVYPLIYQLDGGK